MKPNLYFFNSWNGSFFREQAKLVENQFNIILVNFDSKSIRDFFKLKKFFEIKKYKSQEGILSFDVVYISFWFLPVFFENLMYSFFAKKIVKATNLDFSQKNFIHVNTIYEAGFWANLFYNKYNISYVIDEHQKFILHNKTKRSIKKTASVINQAKQILVVSHDQARQMLTAGFQFEFEVIGNYVDENRFFPINKINTDVFKLISIGAFSYFKDQKTIFKTLKLLDEVEFDKKIEFHYIGFNSWGKNNTKEINALIKSFDYKNIKVVLHEKVYSRDEIAKFLQESDMFILSSIMEGMCVSLMEALACGLPVCTTQCGGVDELINQENGKILQIRDAKGMATFIEKVINGRLKFDKKIIANQLITEYGNSAFKDKLLKQYNKAFFSK